MEAKIEKKSAEKDNNGNARICSVLMRPFVVLFSYAFSFSVLCVPFDFS